jgi:hypothetical protein
MSGSVFLCAASNEPHPRSSAQIRKKHFFVADRPSFARRISIRNGICRGFSPVFTRLVAAARIEALFKDAWAQAALPALIPCQFALIRVHSRPNGFICVHLRQSAATSD